MKSSGESPDPPNTSRVPYQRTTTVPSAPTSSVTGFASAR